MRNSVIRRVVAVILAFSLLVPVVGALPSRALAATLPTVETRPASFISQTAAVLNARIVSGGGSTILERRFSWGRTTTCSDGWTASVGVSGDYFAYYLEGLNPGTTYYFQAWARTSAGWGKGSAVSFTTSQPAAPPLSFTSLTPSTITTSESTYYATLTALGTNFYNVNQITWAWSGPDSGSRTWTKGDSDWNTRVVVNSDSSMTLYPRVLYNAGGTQTLTWSWTVTLRDTTGATATRSFTVTYVPTETVSRPYQPSGPTSGTVGTPYTYTTGGSTSSLGHPVQYLFVWGDGTNSGWLPVGTTSATKTWSLASTDGWGVMVQARCANHPSIVSSWSNMLIVKISPTTSLTFTNLDPSMITTSQPTYDAVLTATGSNFNNVNQITFTWSGPDSGTQTWSKGTSTWSARVNVISDTCMTFTPRVLYNAGGTQILTWSWTVTLRDTTGATASRSFTVRYTPSDTTKPTITSLSVTPKNATLGSPFTISFSASDLGGSGLKQVELWRANDVGGSPGTWAQITSRPVSGDSYSGSFSDTPPSAGSYWYGIHAVDNANNWGAEPTPVKVTVTTSQAGMVIDSYSPSAKITVTAGTSFQLKVWFTNKGDAAYFYPGVSIWDSAPGTPGREPVFSRYGTRTYLPKNAQGSYTWTISLSTIGEYWLQFGVWNDARTQLLHALPWPSANLITVAAPMERYSLTIAINPVGAGTVKADPKPGADGKYAKNTVVTLTANPASGYKFDRWSGTNNNAANPTTVTMNSDKTVMAYFKAVEPETWSFAIITDIHIGDGYADYGPKGYDDYDDYGQPKPTGAPKAQDYYLTERLQKVVQWIIDNKARHNIKFVAVLGDLTTGAEKSQLWKARDILNNLTAKDIPYIPIIGNHEVFPEQAGHLVVDHFFEDILWQRNSENTRLLQERFNNSLMRQEDLERYRGEPYFSNYAFTYGGVNFLCVDVNVRSDKDKASLAEVSSQTETWLEDYIAAYAKNKERPVVVFSHQPLYHGGVPKYWQYFVPDAWEWELEWVPPWGLVLVKKPKWEAVSRVRELIERSGLKVLNFAGHVHGFEEYGLPGLKTPWDWFMDANHKYDDPFCVGARPVITTESVSVGANEKDKDKQTGVKGIVRIVKVTGTEIDYGEANKAEWDEPIPPIALNPRFSCVITKRQYVPMDGGAWLLPIPTEFTFEAKCFTNREWSAKWDFGSFEPPGRDQKSIRLTREQLLPLASGSTVRLAVNLTVTDKDKKVTESIHRVEVIDLVLPAYGIVGPTGTQFISGITGWPLSVTAENRGGVPVIVNVQRSDPVPAGAITVNFDEATADIDLSSLIADVDLRARKSLLYMPLWPPEVEEEKMLFIPSTGVGTIYVCPGATSLEEVTAADPDKVVINVGESLNGMTVTTTYRNGEEYYMVSGVTGTGGGEADWIDRPDLIVNATDIHLSNETPVVGEVVTVNVTVQNMGEADANGAFVTFYDGEPGSGALIGWDAIDVTAGGTAIASVTWNITTPGSREVYVVAQVGGFPRDSDPANNVAFRAVNVRTVLFISSTRGGSVVEPGEGPFPYDIGETVDLLAQPEEGYRFVRWTGDVATIADVKAANTTITMNGYYSITANFVSEGVEPSPTYQYIVDFGDTYPGIAEDFVPPFKVCQTYSFALTLTNTLPARSENYEEVLLWVQLTDSPTALSEAEITIEGTSGTVSANLNRQDPGVSDYLQFDRIALLGANATQTYNATLHLKYVGLYELCFIAYYPTEAKVVAKKPITARSYQWLDAYRIDLYEKWNLISLPLVPFDTDIDAILAALPQEAVHDLVSIWHYDRTGCPESGEWLCWAPLGDEFSTLTEIENGKAYWLRFAYPRAGCGNHSLWVWGTEKPMAPAPPSQYPVCAGWNMVGFTSTNTTMYPKDYLWNWDVPGAKPIVYGWQHGCWAVQGWKPIGWSTTYLAPGQGYWVTFPEERARAQLMLQLPPSPPRLFYGTVSLNGHPVSEGMLVEAFVDGVKRGQTTVDSEGRYGYAPLLKIPGPGGEVTFRVGGVLANESSTWESGTIEALNLTINIAPPTVNLRLYKSHGWGQGRIHFDLTVSNEGPAAAENVVVVDTLPWDLYFEYASDKGIWSEEDRTVTWYLGTVEPNTSRYLYLDVSCPYWVFGENHASATTTTAESSYEDNEGVGYYESWPEHHFDFYISGPSGAAQGDEIMYSLSYQNLCSFLGEAENVQIVYTVPPGVSFVSASDGGTCADGKIIWDLGTGPLDYGEVTVTVKVADDAPIGSTIVNTAYISSTNEFPYPIDNYTYGECHTTVLKGVNLMLSKSSPATKEQGSTITYTIHYKNFGTEPAQCVVITDILPSEVVYVSSSDGGECPTLPGNVVTWNLGTVEALGQGYVTVTVKIQVPIPVGTVITNQATINSTTLETCYDDNDAVARTEIARPLLPPNVGVEPNNGGTTIISVNYDDPITFSFDSCDEATGVDIRIRINDGGPDIYGPMTEGPAHHWTYTTTFFPRYGEANVTYTVYGCTGRVEEIDFSIYIDPAGYVYDVVTGLRISGATVWLQRPDGSGGWENVPTGASPANMNPDVNPLVTGIDGQYQWDVLAGTYRVHVEAAGYYSAYSIVVSVPPPVTDLHIGLIPLNQPPIADAGSDQTVYAIPPATTAMVTLDGSGSYDPDSDPLTYTWTWDGNVAHGVSPTVELPLGTTTITLVVNDGKVDSAPDTVDVTVLLVNVPPVAEAGPDQKVYAIPPATTAMVTLDGSGSYDPDGDPLTYTWTWNGNVAHGVSPTVQLPLGTTTITLVVNDGKVDSEPDTVDVTVLLQATIDFDPDVLNLRSRDKYVTVYIELPTGFDVRQVDIPSIRLNGVVAALTKPTQVGDYDRDRIPDLMIKFSRAEVRSLLTPGNQVGITITGQVAGIPFSGTDTICVIRG